MDAIIDAGLNIKKLLEDHLGRQVQSYSITYDNNVMEIKIQLVSLCARIEHRITIEPSGDLSSAG